MNHFVFVDGCIKRRAADGEHLPRSWWPGWLSAVHPHEVKRLSLVLHLLCQRRAGGWRAETKWFWWQQHPFTTLPAGHRAPHCSRVAVFLPLSEGCSIWVVQTRHWQEELLHGYPKSNSQNNRSEFNPRCCSYISAENANHEDSEKAIATSFISSVHFI